MRLEHILVTTDFSEHSIAAFEFAAYQAKLEGSRITLLHVVNDWPVPVPFYEYIPDPKMIDDYRRNMVKEAEKKLQALIAKSFHGQRVEAEVFLTVEPTAKAIAEFAKKEGVNLIVTSSHGAGAVAEFFLGSVVQSLCRLSQCPLLIVPRKVE